MHKCKHENAPFNDWDFTYGDSGFCGPAVTVCDEMPDGSLRVHNNEYATRVRDVCEEARRRVSKMAPAEWAKLSKEAREIINTHCHNPPGNMPTEWMGNLP